MAPEVENRQPYNEKVDIYSFGVILRLLLTGTAEALQETEDDPTIEYGPSDNSSSDIETGHAVVHAHTTTTTTATTTAIATPPMQILIGNMYVCIRCEIQLCLPRQLHNY